MKQTPAKTYSSKLCRKAFSRQQRLALRSHDLDLDDFCTFAFYGSGFALLLYDVAVRPPRLPLPARREEFSELEARENVRFGIDDNGVQWQQIIWRK